MGSYQMLCKAYETVKLCAQIHDRIPWQDWQQKYKKGVACSLQTRVHSQEWSTERSLFSVNNEMELSKQSRTTNNVDGWSEVIFLFDHNFSVQK